MSSSDDAPALVPVTLIFRREHDDRIFTVLQKVPPASLTGSDHVKRVLGTWGSLADNRSTSFVVLAEGVVSVKLTSENLHEYLASVRHRPGEPS